MQTQRNDMKIEKSVSIHLHALNDHANAKQSLIQIAQHITYEKLLGVKTDQLNEHVPPFFKKTTQKLNTLS